MNLGLSTQVLLAMNKADWQVISEAVLRVGDLSSLAKLS